MKKQRVISYKANHHFRKVSFIRLSGEWLHELGFSIGNTFVLNADKETLTLKLIKQEEAIDDTNVSI